MTQSSINLRQQLINFLAYSERTVRSVSTVLVGASTLLTENLIPKSLRKSTTYRVTLGMLQQFLIEKVAEMKVQNEQFEVSDNFAQRKVVGTAIEAAGLLSIGFSPLWVFAIIGDGVGGSKLYLNRLVEQLKKDGLIESETDITEVADMFDAIEAASSRSATALDMPPLSREDFSKLTADMRTGYGDAFDKTSAVMPELDTMWSSMEALTKRENISMESLLGYMTVDAMKRGSNIAWSASKTGAKLFDEKIINSYRDTIDKVSNEGADNYLANHMRPFLDAASAHFDASKKTWIETKMGGFTNETPPEA